jgi:hypothetical protein
MPLGRSTSTSCPHDRSTSTTAPGITSFSYRSSTMKHRRAGAVSTDPSMVRWTEEMPVLVALRPVLVIWSATSCASRADSRRDTTLDPGGGAP